MATASNDIDDIRHRMAQIRRELHEDVREVVASAEAVTDWHRYIRMYPWVALGAAFAVGFLVVPRRHRKIPKHIATQADLAEVREAVAGAGEKVKGALKDEKTEETVKKGLFATALGVVGSFALRAAKNYAMQYLENWIAQQQQVMMAAGPPPQPTRPPTGPGARPNPGRARGPGAP